MAPIDGAIGMKLKICNAYTSDVSISKAQPSKASGLGGVALQRSKSAPILYKYRLHGANVRPKSCHKNMGAPAYSNLLLPRV